MELLRADKKSGKKCQRGKITKQKGEQEQQEVQEQQNVIHHQENQQQEQITNQTVKRKPSNISPISQYPRW